MNNEKGSILIITLISVLVLSFMVMGLLTVGETESFSTQNNHLNRVAYFAAQRGVEDLRNAIFADPSVESVVALSRGRVDTETTDENGLTYSYFSGSLKDLEDCYYDSATQTATGVVPTIKAFEGFEPPPLKGISLGPTMSISPVIWRVQVTSEVRVTNAHKRYNAYGEIISGVYSILVTGYN